MQYVDVTGIEFRFVGLAPNIGSSCSVSSVEMKSASGKRQCVQAALCAAG